MLRITVFYIYHDCYAPGSETLYGMEIECSYPLYKYFNSIALYCTYLAAHVLLSVQEVGNQLRGIRDQKVEIFVDGEYG